MFERELVDQFASGWEVCGHVDVALVLDVDPGAWVGLQ